MGLAHINGSNHMCGVLSPSWAVAKNKNKNWVVAKAIFKALLGIWTVESNYPSYVNRVELTFFLIVVDTQFWPTYNPFEIVVWLNTYFKTYILLLRV